MPDVDAKARRDFAEEVVVKLRRAGFQALWAGGCVRDILLGLTPTDYDVATDATPEQAMATLPYRALAIGASFGVVKVRHPRQKGNEVEVATFRSDLAYVDGRRPVGVVYSSPREDAERRDFTINGLFMDPTTGEVIDHVGGRADLENRLLRAIGDPAARFEEDKLRLLRAARFAARFGLTIEPTTWEAVRAMAPQIVVVSPERIAEELRKMLTHRLRARATGLLMDAGLLSAVLPPFGAMDSEAQARAARTLDLLPDAPSFPLAMAALLREAGGPRVADDMARGLRLSNTERERLVWLVRHQGCLIDAERLRASALKRLLASAGIEELLALHHAIALATDADAGHVDYCRRYLARQPDGPIDPPPLLTGNDLIGHGLKPGPHFAAILEKVRDAQLESRVRDRGEALEYVDRELAAGLP
ncbi:CCA tRNA nucleotidyltransferase [Paludisphaera sp.]|uniref:CCA tRNA nucleotidyltransferase n=1 Tax=Paludisphaera sp. TaxID=2017432 RepID=UPI00301E3CC7